MADPLTSPILVVNVELNENEVDAIRVYPQDTALPLAQHFCLKHKLPAPVETVLAETIQEHLARLPVPSTEERPSTSSATLSSYQAKWKAFFAGFNGSTSEQPSLPFPHTARRKLSAQGRFRELCPFRPDTQCTQRTNQKLLQQAAVRQSDQPGLQPGVQPAQTSQSAHQQRAHKLSEAMVSKKLKALFVRLAEDRPLTRAVLERPGVPPLLQTLCRPLLQDSQVLNYDEFARVLQKEIDGPDLSRRYALLNMQWKIEQPTPKKTVHNRQVYDRSVEFMRHCNERLARAAEQQRQEEVAQCTFQPAISSKRRRNKSG